MSHSVTVTIQFCYGHRLLNHPGKCKHLHGHNAKLEIEITSDALDDRGMVEDFGDVKRIVKGWVDEWLDHTMLLEVTDPVMELLEQAGEKYYPYAAPPTAETIVQHIWISTAIELRDALQNGEITAMRLWESPSSYATYRP